MSASDARGFLAIDIGSSRVKLGWFPQLGECASEAKPTTLPIAAPQLPQPEETLAVSHRANTEFHVEINEWLLEHCATASRRFLASVHPTTTAMVKEILPGRLRVLTIADLQIEIHVNQPERVGIDRLINAVAVNRLRLPQQPAIVVDLGTACTVDLIAADGAFEGGAILPGMTLSAAALHSGTAALPQLTTENFASTPAVVGKSTQAAIASGLYWGMVGAIGELIDRMRRECDSTPQLFLTGGGASRLVAHLANESEPIRHVPNLMLAGIAVVAEELL